MKKEAQVFTILSRVHSLVYQMLEVCGTATSSFHQLDFYAFSMKFENPKNNVGEVYQQVHEMQKWH